MIMRVVGAGELRLELDQLLKERVGTNSEAQPSSRATLDYASQDKVEEGLKATRNVNSIVVEKQAIKKVEEALGEAICFKDGLHPFMAHARKSSFKVPKGKDGFTWEEVVRGEGPRNGVNINNI